MTLPDFAIFSSTFLNIFQGLIILINFTLGLIAFLQSPKERINKIFFMLTIVIDIWIAGFILLRLWEPLYGLRIAFAGASLIPIFLLGFSSSFPKKFASRILNNFKIFIFILGSAFAIVSFFTNFIVQEIKYFSPSKLIYTAGYGNFYSAFSVFFLSTIVISIILLIQQFRKTKNIERKQAFYVILGLIVAIIPATITNLIIPMITGNSTFAQFGPLAITIFIMFCFYAIAKHGLFNAKIIATEIFVVAISSILLFEIFLEKQTTLMLFRFAIFAVVAIFGILLIKSVLNEVSAKEKIQNLAKDLEAANVELKKLDKAKSEFLSIASHQLRTPLTAIKGYSSMILEGAFGKFSEGVKDATGKILESSRQLVLMIDDFLDISKIEAGKMSYEFSTFNLDDLIKKMVKGFLDNNKKARELNLKYITSNQDFPIRGDINKISQVVSNLLDNAVKYTPTGYINVHLDKNQKGDAAILTVKDTGIGISKETMAKLFQKFSRSEKSSLFNTSGSGLGLYVAKRIITDHKGRIWVESDGPGKGSSFFVELPLG